MIIESERRIDQKSKKAGTNEIKTSTAVKNRNGFDTTRRPVPLDQKLYPPIASQNNVAFNLTQEHARYLLAKSASPKI